ncbi:unnamed protein product [Mesocestoides corti]|nr:unnamed protein product [Mesocestoides corti]
MATDLRVKILNNPLRSSGPPDARILLNKKKQIKNIRKKKGILNRVLSQQIDVPFLIPRRTVKNEYFQRKGPSLYLRQGNPSAHNVRESLTRTISNQPASRIDFQELASASVVSPIQGFRVEVRNLGPSVTLDDIYELFSGVGPLRSCNLVRPGLAEVVFNSATDAQSAVARYNSRELDSRPMLVTLVTPGAGFPSKPDRSAPPLTTR